MQRETTTGAVEPSWAMLPAGCGGQNRHQCAQKRHQCAQKVVVRADIPRGDSVADKIPSGLNDALSVGILVIDSSCVPFSAPVPFSALLAASHFLLSGLVRARLERTLRHAGGPERSGPAADGHDPGRAPIGAPVAPARFVACGLSHGPDLVLGQADTPGEHLADNRPGNEPGLPWRVSPVLSAAPCRFSSRSQRLGPRVPECIR